MLVKMTHPKHGTTHAHGAEIAWNKANGWRIEQETAPAPAPEIVPLEVAAEVADELIDSESTPAERYEQKFGKPPHHRMLESTILAALKD